MLDEFIYMPSRLYTCSSTPPVKRVPGSLTSHLGAQGISCICRCRRVAHITHAATEQSTTSSAASNEYIPDSEFAISKVSFGSILTPVGLGLMLYGFGAYGFGLPGGDLSSLMLIYGFPISVLGFALSYAQVGGHS